MLNTRKKSKSISQLCMKLNNLKMDEGMQEPTETAQKDKSAAKLKRAKKLAQKAKAKAAEAKAKLKKIKKEIKLKEARDVIAKKTEFDGPSTSKAALRHDEECRSAYRTEKRLAIADETKKKQKSMDKKYEGRQPCTFAGSKAPSNLPQREVWDKQIAVLLEYNDRLNRGKKAIKVKPRESTKKGKKEQPLQIDDKAEFPSFGQQSYITKLNSGKQSKSILQLCMKFNNLKMDEGMQEPTETAQKDKSEAKLKPAKNLVQKAKAKAADAKAKLKKIKKQIILKEARDIIAKKTEFDGPSTSKAALRRDEECRSAYKTEKRLAIADETKKKHKSNAMDKMYEGRQAGTFAESKVPSNLPQRVAWDKQITEKGKKEQPLEIDDKAEFPSFGQRKKE